jgi:hypothetical protein
MVVSAVVKRVKDDRQFRNYLQSGGRP